MRSLISLHCTMKEAYRARPKYKRRDILWEVVLRDFERLRGVSDDMSVCVRYNNHRILLTYARGKTTILIYNEVTAMNADFLDDFDRPKPQDVASIEDAKPIFMKGYIAASKREIANIADYPNVVTITHNINTYVPKDKRLPKLAYPRRWFGRIRCNYFVFTPFV